MSWSFDKLDLANVNDEGGRATLRPGNHAVKIAEAEIKTTKAGTGKYLQIKLANEEGQYVTDRINVHNPNPKIAPHSDQRYHIDINKKQTSCTIAQGFGGLVFPSKV